MVLSFPIKGHLWKLPILLGIFIHMILFDLPVDWMDGDTPWDYLASSTGTSLVVEFLPKDYKKMTSNQQHTWVIEM